MGPIEKSISSTPGDLQGCTEAIEELMAQEGPQKHLVQLLCERARLRLDKADTHSLRGAVGIKKALADAQQAVRLEPLCTDGHRLCAVALQKLHRLDEARSSLQELVTLSPDESVAGLRLSLLAAEISPAFMAERSLRQLDGTHTMASVAPRLTQSAGAPATSANSLPSDMCVRHMPTRDAAESYAPLPASGSRPLGDDMLIPSKDEDKQSSKHQPMLPTSDHAADELPQLRVGACVRVHGLSKRIELNGSIGTVRGEPVASSVLTSSTPKVRYPVRITSVHGVLDVLLCADNLSDASEAGEEVSAGSFESAVVEPLRLDEELSLEQPPVVSNQAAVLSDTEVLRLLLHVAPVAGSPGQIDWSHSATRLRSLLMENAGPAISERRLRKLKSQFAVTAKSTHHARVQEAPLMPTASERHTGALRDALKEGERMETIGRQLLVGEVELRANKGRCAIAVCKTYSGTIVGGFSSTPFAAFLLPIYETSRCEACFAKLPGVTSTAASRAQAEVRCQQSGCYARYCSARCRKADAVLHRPICAFLADPMSPLSMLRCECDPSCPDRYGALVLSLKCLWRRHHASTDDDGREREQHALFDEMLSCGPSDPADYELASLAARLEGLLPPGTSASDVSSLLSRLQTNMFSFTDDDGSAIIGCGCYPKAAVLNHSCAPNCVLNYGPHGVLEVRAARNIDPGEELCHSYVDLCMPTRMRQQALRNRYFFDCDCTRCSKGITYNGEDPDFLMEAVVAGSAIDEDGCRELEAHDHETVDRLIKLSETALSRAEQTNDLQSASKLASQALAIRRKHCHPLSLLRYHAESAMDTIAQRMGDTKCSRECGRHAVAFLEMALSHVDWHATLSIQRMHLACSEAELGDMAEALRQMDLCVPAIVITHGPDHSMTLRALAVRRALRKKAADLQAGTSPRVNKSSAMEAARALKAELRNATALADRVVRTGR